MDDVSGLSVYCREGELYSFRVTDLSLLLLALVAFLDGDTTYDVRYERVRLLFFVFLELDSGDEVLLFVEKASW